MRLKRRGLLRGIRDGRVQAYADMKKTAIFDYDKVYGVIQSSETLIIRKVKILEELYKVTCDEKEFYLELKTGKNTQLN